MADVFISYAREDRARAEQVANALAASGIQAFWDTEIPPGQSWADYIEGKLTQCKAQIVLWSAHSATSQWVREEARMGKEARKLIPAMLDATPPPFGFGEVQGADLSTWTGDPNDANWLRLRGAVEAAIRRESAAPPRPIPPPSNVAPPPQSFSSAIAATPGISPSAYVMRCFQKYVDGKGRARRSEYWWFTLFYTVVLAITLTLDVSLYGINSYTGAPNNAMFTTLAALAMVCPYFAVASRRLHDVGMNGWLAALGIVPYLGFLFLAVIGFITGQPQTNQYGPNPKAG